MKKSGEVLGGETDLQGAGRSGVASLGRTGQDEEFRKSLDGLKRMAEDEKHADGIMEWQSLFDNTS